MKKILDVHNNTGFHHIKLHTHILPGSYYPALFCYRNAIALLISGIYAVWKPGGLACKCLLLIQRVYSNPPLRHISS